MDSRRTHVATHYVSPRRGCPALIGVAYSLGECDLKSNPDTIWHPVQNTLLLVPAGTIDCGTAKQRYSIGEVRSASATLLIQPSRTGNATRLLAQARACLTA